MEKSGSTNSPRRRSIGVTVFGVLGIIFSILILFTITPKVFTNIKIQTVLQITAALVWLFFSIGVLKLKSWARPGLIVVAIYFIVDTFLPPKIFLESLKKYPIPSLIMITISLIFFCYTIYFFTHPKVKEQFK